MRERERNRGSTLTGQVHWTRLRSRTASIDTTRVIAPPKVVYVAVAATVHHFLKACSIILCPYLSSRNPYRLLRLFGIRMSKQFIFIINIIISMPTDPLEMRYTTEIVAILQAKFIDCKLNHIRQYLITEVKRTLYVYTYV